MAHGGILLRQLQTRLKVLLQRLRALRRGQEDLGRDLGVQTAIAKAKEQEANQKALLALKRGDRQLAEKYAHEAGSAVYKGTGRGGGGGGRSPGQDFGSKLQSGLKILKTGKDIWDTASSFFEEGGKVEGPGSETSDSIPARLSDGEFVVKASAVRGLGKQLGAKNKDEEREKGVDFLYKLQDKMDKAEKFKDGGEIKRFISMLSPEQRRKAAAEEKFALLDRESKKMGPKKGFRAWRPDQKKVDEIDKKYGIDQLDMEEEDRALDEYRKSPKFLDILKKERKIKKTGKFAKGGEAYVRPKKAFREAIGYEPESRFHDKAEKDAKFGGARRKFRHFKHGGEVSFGSVVSAKKRLNKNLEKLKRK